MSEEKKLFVPKFSVYSPADLSKKWFVYFYENGKRVRVYGHINKYKTRNARIKAAENLIDDLKKEGRGAKKKIEGQIYQWLEKKKPLLRKKSYQTYKSKIDNFLTYVGPYLTQEKVRGFFEKIRSDRHSTTYNKYLQLFKQIFNDIGEEKLIEDLKKVKAIRTPARYFLPSQVKLIKRHLLVADPELWFFCQFIYYCFIRPGELRLLKVSDVLFDEKRVFIRGKISKNRKNQYVAIPEAFLADLHKNLDSRNPNEYIFPGKTSIPKPIGIGTMSHKHLEMLRQLGFDSEYKLYSWKHTGAVMAVKAGVGVKELQMQLRHHSLDQVNEYLRQMGVWDMDGLRNSFPEI